MDASVGGLSIETFDVFQTLELEITQFHFGLEENPRNHGGEIAG